MVVTHEGDYQDFARIAEEEAKGALDSIDDIEEERRLCYVGMTRAKERLHLTSAAKRNIFGQSLDRTESRFLREVKKGSKVKIEIDIPDMYNNKFSGGRIFR